jgi:3-phosphoglycerate kinase
MSIFQVRAITLRTQRESFCLRSLASLSDGYVNDAFGTSHRAHASTAGVPAILDSKLCGVGYLVASEIAYLDFKSLQPGETVSASKFLPVNVSEIPKKHEP